MKIKDLDFKEISIPLKKPFKTALREVTLLKTNVIKITTDTGEIGYGEASPTAVITGDIRCSIEEAIKEYIFPQIKGMDIDNIEDIMININKSVHNNTSAKAAIDMAVYDLFGQRYKLPLYKFFGGARNSICSDITISVKEPEKMAKDAVEYVSSGYDTLKLKVGIESNIDIKRVRAIRDAVGEDIKIRLDANQGWRAKEAVRVIRTMEDMGLNIELVEQPVPYWDIEGLKFVTENVDIAIMADESLFSPYDAFRLIGDRCVDILNIKLMKCGGFYNAQKIINIAESCGVECMIGSMMESKVGITAAAHFAGGKRNITRADLDAASLLAEDPVEGGVSFNRNEILIAEGYGLGIRGIR